MGLDSLVFYIFLHLIRLFGHAITIAVTYGGAVFIFIVLFLVAQINAQIVQSSSLNVISSLMRKSKPNQALVVFDLDETLLESPFKALKKPYHFFKSLFGPTENDAPEIVRSLQNRGIHVMALTARSKFFATFTQYQLQKAGFDFSKNSPSAAQELDLDGIYYKEGVVFAGRGGDKGKILVQILQYFNRSYEQILFVDNLYENCFDVEKAMSETFPLVKVLCLFYVRP